jgi:hypothetical protein
MTVSECGCTTAPSNSLRGFGMKKQSQLFFWSEEMSLFHLNRYILKCCLGINRHSLLAILTALVYSGGLAGCGDVSTAPVPDPGPGPLTIVTHSPLPSGTVNQPYATALGGSGGTTPYTWSLANGSPALPAGLSLKTTTGTIIGTPTALVTTTPIFRLVDSSSPEQAVQKSLTITITTTPQPLVMTTASIPNGIVNQPYPTTTLSATGGIQPYTWSVDPGLPNGLQFNVVSSGTISGIPLIGSNGTTSHTFTVTDSALPLAQTDTQVLSLTINSILTPVTITTNSLTDGRINRPYSATLRGSGGNLPYTWSVTPDLPTGLTLNGSTGAITGTPVPGTVGKEDYTFRVQDSAIPLPQNRSRVIELEIKP